MPASSVSLILPLETRSAASAVEYSSRDPSSSPDLANDREQILDTDTDQILRLHKSQLVKKEVQCTNVLESIGAKAKSIYFVNA